MSNPDQIGLLTLLLTGLAVLITSLGIIWEVYRRFVGSRSKAGPIVFLVDQSGNPLADLILVRPEWASIMPDVHGIAKARHSWAKKTVSFRDSEGREIHSCQVYGGDEIERVSIPSRASALLSEKQDSRPQT